MLVLTAASAAEGDLSGRLGDAKGYYVPEPPPPTVGVAVPAGVSGLWYDPLLDGEGYNFIVTETSEGPVLVVFFYGFSAAGERLWLVSENIPLDMDFGQPVSAIVYEAHGGTFDAPAPSAGALSAWGSMTLLMEGCLDGTIVLDGGDGQKISVVTKLAGIESLDCDSPSKGVAAGQAGLWFDQSLDGEGYNIISSAAGTVVFFYGYNAAGERLWLISDVSTGDSGGVFTVPVWEAVGGTFATPVPSSESLRAWGSISVDLGCSDGSITLDGADGVKLSSVAKLAGIAGTGC